MPLCPYCHKPHDDAPTAGRARVCAACHAAAGSSPAKSKPSKKRRSKQTPAPIEAASATTTAPAAARRPGHQE